MDAEPVFVSAFVTRAVRKIIRVLCSDFVAIHFRHRDISRQKVYEPILQAVPERVETQEQRENPKRRSARLSPPPQTPQMP